MCCPNWLHPRGCCPATSGTSCGRNLGVIDQILNEWCDPFVSAARLNEWFATNFGAADEPTADYRTPRRRAADSGGAGRTATGIGREKGVERLLLGRGPYLATPTSARNAPSDTPGDRARARHCVSGLFCVRDDLAEIAAIKGRGCGQRPEILGRHRWLVIFGIAVAIVTTYVLFSLYLSVT